MSQLAACAVHGRREVGTTVDTVARPDLRPMPDCDLRRQLADARAQLQAATADVARLNSAAEDFRAGQMASLAFVAHELRNPLAPIRNANAVLRRGRPEDIVAMSQIIERQASRMSRMIDDLLDVSRASTGKLRLIPGCVAIDDLFAQAADNAAPAPALAGRGQRLEIVGSGEGQRLRGDLTRLVQVLANLLDNASKYSPNRQTVRLTARYRARSVEISVVDNGIGLTAKALKKVFEPFAQEPHAVGFDATGLGIGLAVVRDIVAAHGGRVTASSAGLGQGSCFVVTLPCETRPASRES